MAGTLEIWNFVLRGIAVGALVPIAAAFWRAGMGGSARFASLIFCASTAAYTLNSCQDLHDMLGLAHWPVHLLSFGGVGWLWLFVVVLFEDRPVSPWTLAPGLALTLVGLIAYATPWPAQQSVWIGHNLIEGGFAIHALVVVAQSWRSDLVQERRVLRGPFIVAVVLFALVQSTFEIAESRGFFAAWTDIVEAAALAFLGAGGATLILQANPVLFGAAKPAPAPAAAIDAGDRLVLTKLTELMDAGEIWRSEGLTIGDLAEKAGIPEHRLRRLINDHLGHRNFAAFVNARRIEAAKQALADPAKARTPVSSIAFDLGFGSLGPFNRAFKEATGATPSEWRRQTLETGSPISEKPA